MSEMIHDKYPKVKLVGAQDGYVEDKENLFNLFGSFIIRYNHSKLSFIKIFGALFFIPLI